MLSCAAAFCTVNLILNRSRSIFFFCIVSCFWLKEMTLKWNDLDFDMNLKDGHVTCERYQSSARSAGYPRDSLMRNSYSYIYMRNIKQRDVIRDSSDRPHCVQHPANNASFLYLSNRKTSPESNMVSKSLKLSFKKSKPH